MNHRFGGPDYVVGADSPRLDEKALLLPLKWKEPRRIFVCSMTDLFLDEHTDEMIGRVWGLMEQAKHHTFQVLTKRIEADARLGLEFPGPHESAAERLVGRFRGEPGQREPADPAPSPDARRAPGLIEGHMSWLALARSGLEMLGIEIAAVTFGGDRPAINPGLYVDVNDAGLFEEEA